MPTSILGFVGIALIVLSFTAAVILMFRAISGIGAAPRPVSDADIADVTPTPRIYNYGDDSTLVTIELVGLVLGGIFLIFTERSNQNLFFFMGIAAIITSVLSAVAIMVVGLFGLRVPSSSATAGWAIYFVEILAAIVFFIVAHNGTMIDLVGIILIAVSLLSVVVLLFGAVSPGRIPDVDRRTLWTMFASSLLLGIFVIYLPTILTNLFGF